MNIFDTVLGLIAPDICVGCNKEGSVLCQECTDLLPRIDTPICFYCGKHSKNFKTCPNCISRTMPQHVWTCVRYEELPKELVQTYKFSWNRRVSYKIAELMDEALPYFAEAPLVTFVPTAPSHVRERSFDHAGLIAKELAKLRGWNYVPLLVRQKSVQQHGATRKDRLEQIKGAFRVKSTMPVNKQQLLLIDDVVTTGATLSECTKMLKAAGAARVDAVVFARTSKN